MSGDGAENTDCDGSGVRGGRECLLWCGGDEENNIYCGGVVMMEKAFTVVLVTW